MKYMAIVLLATILGAKVRPYSEYLSMSPDQKYEELRLRFLLNQFDAGFGSSKNIKAV